MAKPNCSACDDLREFSPNLIVNGLGDTECTSLANDTGLNPSSGHNDCDDLHDLNDCLVGNLEPEIDAYDVCDWKEFTRKFIENVWTTLKGIICAICGLWTNVHELQAKNDSLCALVDALVEPPLQRFGSVNNKYGQEHPANRGGRVGTKGGTPVVVPMAQSELTVPSWDGQNVGIRHGRQNINSCSTGRCLNYEWITPNFVGYKVNDDITLETGDIIWVASREECMAWGISEEMWEAFTISSWTWVDFGLGGTPKGTIWIRLSVENGRLEMSYQGKVGADQLTAGRRLMEPDEPAKLYRFDC